MRAQRSIQLLILVAAAIALLAQPVRPAPAQTAPAPASIAPFYATADTYVSENAPDTNYGADSRLDVRQDEFLAESFALLRFNLASIPAGSIVNSARFYAYLSNAGSYPGNPKLSIYGVIGAWSATTVTWNTKPSTVLTAHYLDVTSTLAAKSWDVTDMAQCWVDRQPLCTDASLALRAHPDYNATFTRDFDSLQGANRPYLVIDYTPPPTHTPTPSHTPIVSNTPTPTGTQLTSTPTDTPTSTPTSTQTPSPTVTPVPASIGDRVWHDIDRNGRRDVGEPGLAGVQLTLVRNSDHLDMGSETTDANGAYLFENLAPGDYTVDIDIWSVPPGYRPTNGAVPREVAVGPGEDRRDVDFGYTAEPTPTPGPATTTDLYFVDWDWVQVAHGAPLVADKPTLVRVYVGLRGSGHPVQNVTGRLLRVGIDTWDTALRSDNSINVEPPPPGADPKLYYPADKWDEIGGTLNFTLPDDWRQGSYTANVWIDYDNRVAECGGCESDNNIGTGWQHFEATVPLRVYVIRASVGGVSPARARIPGTTEYLERVFPVSSVAVYSHPSDGFDADYDYDGPHDPGECPEGWSDLLDRLRQIAADTDDPVPGAKYYGLLRPTIDSPDVSGCGSTSGRVSAGKARDGDRFKQTMTHEMAHNFGRQHVPSDGPDCRDPGDVDDNYPNETGQLDGYGIDLSTDPPTIFSPGNTWDLMSYCRPREMSAYTFSRLLDHFRSNAVTHIGVVSPGHSAKASLAAGGAYLCIDGRVRGEAVEQLYPFYQISAASDGDQPGSGAYTVELLNAAGQPLFTRAFDPQPYGNVHGDPAPSVPAPISAAHLHGADQTAFFHETVPFPTGTTMVVIKRGAIQIASRPVSPHGPRVTLVAPNGGEQWPAGGSRTISWSASDSDGQALYYTLQYSRDSGATWQALAVNLTAQQYQVDSAVLGGSTQALIRVTATDGVNTGQDASDAPFAVARKPPEAYIVSPEHGADVRPGRLVELGAQAIDLEDQELADSAFNWSSDRQGTLDTGRRTTVANLLPGYHALTLKVTDGDGMVGTASARIYVGYRVWLPLSAR